MIINNNNNEGDESEYEEVEEEIGEEEEIDENGEIVVRRRGRYCLDCSVSRIKRDCDHPITETDIQMCFLVVLPLLFIVEKQISIVIIVIATCIHSLYVKDLLNVHWGYRILLINVEHMVEDSTLSPFALGCSICGPIRRTMQVDPNDYSSYQHFNELFYY